MSEGGRVLAVDNVVAFTGGGQRNRGSMFIALKPLAERGVPAAQVIARLRTKLAREPGAQLFLTPVQDIRVGGRASSAQYQYTLQSDDLQQLYEWVPKITAELEKLPQLTDVNSDQEQKGLQTDLVIDRATASRLGLSDLRSRFTEQKKVALRHMLRAPDGALRTS